MKRFIQTLGIALLGIMVGYCSADEIGAGADPYQLVMIPQIDGSQIQFLKDISVSLGFVDDQTAVALVRGSDFTALTATGVIFDILEEVEGNERFALVSLPDQTSRKGSDAIEYALLRRGERALIRVDEGNRSSTDGCKLLKLFFIPPAHVGRRDVSLSRSPLTDNIIHQVSTVRRFDWIRELQDFQTRYAYAGECSLAADYLIEQFEGFGLDVEEDWFFNSAWISYDDPQRNIIATLPGTTYPDEIVAICAHYDSYSGNSPWTFAPGADDNRRYVGQRF